MLTILAIESSAETASVALVRGGVLLGERQSPHAQSHSQHLLPMVQAVLAEAGIALSACNAIAFGAGPGSFTGVRTACGVAQGLAFGANLPVVPVVTLLAMARRCLAAHGAADVTALLDARMGEVYWARYRHDDAWRELVAPQLSAPGDVAIEAGSVACGNALAAYPEPFAHLPGAQRHYPGVMPAAVDIAHLAAFEFEHGRAIAARDAQPIYLRNKVALTTAERMARQA